MLICRWARRAERNGCFWGAICLIRDFQMEWDKQRPRCHLHRLHGRWGQLYQIYTLQAPIGGQVTPTRFWTLVLPGSGLSGYIPDTDAEPHTSDYQAFHLADCTNLQTTKLCRLHHFGIYTAPNYSQWTWLPLVQKPLLKFGLGNRSGGYNSARLNQTNRQHRNMCWRSTD